MAILGWTLHPTAPKLARASTAVPTTLTRHGDIEVEITPDVLLKAYACGIFPMAETADDPGLYWIEPRERGVIPLDGFHLPRRLARTIRGERFEIRIDSDFEAVIAACASPAQGREKTWINGRIRRLYTELYRRGHCHTIEAWQDGRLVGGLYGVRLGRAFFGESMFHRERDASKVALAHLVARLKRANFALLDAQFLTEHLWQFGAVEIDRVRYQRMLADAVQGEAQFDTTPMSGAACVGILSGG